MNVSHFGTVVYGDIWHVVSYRPDRSGDLHAEVVATAVSRHWAETIAHTMTEATATSVVGA